MLALLGAGVASQVPFLYRRFHVYPRTEAALADIRRTAGPAEPRPDGLLDLRGVIHVHTYLSHDSMGTPGEVIAAARKVGLDFVFTADHYGWLTDNHVISQALRGEHDGVLFVAGAEMRDGVMPFFLDRPPSRYNPHQPLQGFVDDVRALGAVVFLNHPEDPRRRWDLKNWAGMEIYNLHTDARQARLSLLWRLSEQLWSMERYPMRVYHQLFREPRDYLKLWDRFTERRRIVGIAGNDAHQNNGLRLVVSRAGTIVLADTSGAEGPPIWEGHGRISRALARALFGGELAPGRTLWRVDADLYERSFHYVSTRLLAPAKTERDLRAALESGHAYVAFDSLVTATGFDFALLKGDQSRDPQRQGAGPAPLRVAIMGDEVRFEPQTALDIRSPVPATLRLIRNGGLIREQHSRRLLFPVHEPGVYRAEAHLDVRGKLVPWVYSNPIYIR